MVQTDTRCTMTDKQKRELMQKVFDKLEKHARLTRIERMFGLKEPQMQTWLESWEGEEPEQNITPGDLFMGQAMAAANSNGMMGMGSHAPFASFYC